MIACVSLVPDSFYHWACIALVSDFSVSIIWTFLVMPTSSGSVVGTIDDLKLRDKYGYTAFARAAIVASIEIAKVLVAQDRSFFSIKDNETNLPLTRVAMYGQGDMALLLYKMTRQDLEQSDMAWFLYEMTRQDLEQEVPAYVLLVPGVFCHRACIALVSDFWTLLEVPTSSGSIAKTIDDLKLRDKYGYIAFAKVAIAESIEIAKVLLAQDQSFLSIKENENNLPLTRVAMYGKGDMALFFMG
ncbi:hypothetical protein Patl1_17935 [Pistacia atlantica]|uniref:Uncharacterized protein n=1 Tax=Pistacia atlantica TaxID=434234 RepID=A0ACC1BZI6_9ROSI|nr:hypothetical protein Patl1_17935 [Pistacia atlantica]